MKKSRLWWQIFSTSLLITILALVAVSWYASDLGRDFYLNKTSENLEIRAKLITGLIADSSGQKLHTDRLKGLEDEIETRITIILADGRVIYDSDEDPQVMDNHKARPEVAQALDGAAGTSMRFSNTVKKNMMYVAVPYVVNDKPYAVVRTSRDVEAIDETISALQQRIVYYGLFITALTALISLYTTRRISNPLEQIIIGVEKFADGELHARLPDPPTREMSKLASALNKMAAQIDEKMETITQQRNQQKAVFESMAEGVIAVDRGEKVISINTAAARLLGSVKKSMTGQQVDKIITNTQLKNMILGCLKSNQRQEAEIVLKHPEEQYVKVQASTLKAENGDTIGALLVLNDVTRLRHLESGRREFVANVSHEIRTPLTSIKGFVEALQEGAISEPDNARKFLDIIARQTNRLSTILEDLLTLSRLEREGEHDEISFNKEKIKPILEEALQICEPKAEKKNAKIHVECDPDLRARLNAPLVEEALINLIDNAIKYSPDGRSIWLSAEKSDGEMLIRVKDEGNGIAREHLPRIFERFYRVDKARSRKMGGTGLGLAIVKHIALVHGGRVEVDSDTGKGSTFTIHLPALD